MYTSDPEAQLAYPHYSDLKWRSPQFIYLKAGIDRSRKSRNGEYSDRLAQWDADADKRGREAVKANGTKFRSAKNIHLYLEAYYQKKVDLLAIQGGVNMSSGYEYYVYYYDLIDDETLEPSPNQTMSKLPLES
jgi:hypothetical protein